MALKRFLIFTLINVVLTTMVFSAPTTRQSAVTTRQNQTTSSLGAVVNQSGAPAGLMMQAPRITGLEFQIRGLLLEHAKAAVNMILQKYPFINRRPLNPPLTRLGLDILKQSVQRCKTMTIVDKLGVLHAKLATFIDPLDLAYQYELNLSPQHAALVQRLKLSKDNLDEIVAVIRKEYPQNLTIPAGKTITESVMDREAKIILTKAQTLTGVAPTTANVKIYRNFVILNTLKFVIGKVMTPCMP